MEFIELTKPEYKRILRRLILVTPLTEPLKIVWLFVLIGIFIGVTRETATWLSVTLTALLFLALRPGVILLSILFRRPYYQESHEEFVSKVQQLGASQYEQLSSEYPSAKRISIYYDRGKRLLGSEMIYVTDHFLFMPGLFLINREDIDEISVSGPRAAHEFTTTFTFALKEQSKQKLTMCYRYKICPETAEQIMAWFWQCDPSDPTLPERTKAWYEMERHSHGI